MSSGIDQEPFSIPAVGIPSVLRFTIALVGFTALLMDVLICHRWRKLTLGVDVIIASAWLSLTVWLSWWWS